jgi:hypothetical protein
MLLLGYHGLLLVLFLATSSDSFAQFFLNFNVLRVILYNFGSFFDWAFAIASLLNGLDHVFLFMVAFSAF